MIFQLARGFVLVQPVTYQMDHHLPLAFSASEPPVKQPLSGDGKHRIDMTFCSFRFIQMGSGTSEQIRG